MNEINIVHLKKEVKEVLRKFQQGYTERDIENVDVFVKDIFMDVNKVSILGTGTEELFLGINEVKELIKSDWKYWGDVTIDYENTNITSLGDCVWISVEGSVKHSFENTSKQYDSYVNFVENNLKDHELSSKQKITYINWALALAYHQRPQGKREYLWPLALSGVLLKHEDKYKFIHVKFSIPKSDFPDERFEDSKKHRNNYFEQKNKISKYKYNQATSNIINLLKNFEIDVLKNEKTTKSDLEKYFTDLTEPYIIDPDNRWLYGVDEISKFFINDERFNISLDMEHLVVHKADDVTWVILNGVFEQNFSEEEIMQKSLREIENLVESKLKPEEKIFAVKRASASVLKESSMGSKYTYPIRITALITNSYEKSVFNFMHFSFPFYWMFEGKF